jgi:serine protease Do
VSVIITKDLPKMEQGTRRVPFGRGFIELPEMLQNGTEQREVGGGTAFFVSADGILMTNKHVVTDEHAAYSVLLNDGRTLPATVIGRDAVNDIALLKVEGGGFAPLAIAPDDEIHLGQTAIAIGNALGEFRNTVSVGVVSGLQRSIIAGGLGMGRSEQLDQIIQTDAAINSGNSGGPLLNSRGQVIGMNTAVASMGNGIGFALPAKELRRVHESYRKNGRIVTAFLGIRYAQITAELQKLENLPFDYGVLAVAGDDGDPAVAKDSPAEKAGLRERDIILEIDGKKLTPDQPFARIIQGKSPGDTVTLKLWRQGKESELKVQLGEWK